MQKTTIFGLMIVNLFLLIGCNQISKQSNLKEEKLISSTIFLENVFQNYDNSKNFEANLNSSIDNLCQTIANKYDYWIYDKEKSSGITCVLKSDPIYNNKWGSWEIQSEWNGNSWNKIIYNACGTNFELKDGKCYKIKNDDIKTKTDNNNYLGSEYKGNYVWGGAMNLAWTELNNNILHENLKLNTNDKIALEMVDKLNNPIFTKQDLDEQSYYIKSGYGQEIVDIINQESRAKFPTKSFKDLNFDDLLAETDIISYAYFLKEVAYKSIFEKKEVYFEGQKVKGFYAKDNNQRDNVKIIKYESDDKFILSLKLKDESDQLILAKGYDMTNPQIVVSEINKNNKDYLTTIEKSDNFEAPKLHLDHERNYIELIGQCLANKNFEPYCIEQMFENIKFDMDEKGAKVENEAVIRMILSMKINPEKPKNLILDKPYWVIMQRKNSQNPYFILGVKNTELMEK